MKLSDAILCGINKVSNQNVGAFFEVNDDLEIVSCCALGAAALCELELDEAQRRYQGIDEVQYISEFIRAKFDTDAKAPDVLRKNCTQGIYIPDTVADCVVALNDHFFKSFEEIAAILKEHDL